MTEKQILGFKPAPRLEHTGDEHSSACRIASIAFNDEIILPYDANPKRIEFSEETPAYGLLQALAFFQACQPAGRSRRSREISDRLRR